MSLQAYVAGGWCTFEIIASALKLSRAEFVQIMLAAETDDGIGFELIPSLIPEELEEIGINAEGFSFDDPAAYPRPKKRCKQSAATDGTDIASAAAAPILDSQTAECSEEEREWLVKAEARAAKEADHEASLEGFALLDYQTHGAPRESITHRFWNPWKGKGEWDCTERYCNSHCQKLSEQGNADLGCFYAQHRARSQTALPAGAAD